MQPATLSLALAGWFAFAPGVMSQPAGQPQPTLPTIAINAGLHVIQAEVANTDSTRSVGLMFRQSMAPNRGMLFVFAQHAPHCMWMKNTLIPLSVAFIDDDGKIVNIAEMKPKDETTHCATGPVRYALEMNKGWFDAKSVKPGSRVSGLEKAPGPR